MAQSLTAIQTKVTAYVAHLVSQHLDTSTVDVMLDMERQAYEQAMTAGDLDHADEHYRRLDLLLDHRLTMPQQRRTVRPREIVASLLVLLAGTLLGAWLGWLEFDGLDVDI